jgi:glycosyltransferase involved in cell wall biosynthesis
MGNPLVSVIMATFNEPAKYIKEAIESILNQTYSNFEFIIIDDSINSDTIQAINSYKYDSRVIIIRESSRLGFVGALNQGLKIAKGQYIARMDADDISFKDRLKKQVTYLERTNDIDILGGNMQIINETGDVVSQRKYLSGKYLLQLSSIFRSPVAHPTVMFRRSIIDQHLFYDESFLKSEDVDFWFRLRNNGFKIANLSDNFLYFRISGDLAKKRSKEHFSYNYKARCKNFSWRYFYVDIPSIIVTKLYLLIPKKIFTILYSIENKNIF